MVSKVMPLWVGTYDDWLAFEEQVIQVKIPHFLSYYNNSDKSSRKSDSSRSDTSENTFSDTDNVVSQPRKRLEKQSLITSCLVLMLMPMLMMMLTMNL